MNCPKCHDSVSFTDKYCNSCGAIVNKLLIQQSEQTLTTEAEVYVSLTNEQKIYVPNGSYRIKKVDLHTYNFVNEQDETIATFQQYSEYSVDKTKYAVIYLIILCIGGALLLSLVPATIIQVNTKINILYPILVFFIPMGLFGILASNSIYKSHKEKELGMFLDKKGRVLGKLLRKSFKYYVKTTEGVILLLTGYEPIESKLMIYTMENIYWSQEQETFMDGYYVKNGTYNLTNGEGEIALLLNPSPTEDSFYQTIYPKNCDMEVYKDNYEPLLLLTWGLIRLHTFL